MPVARGARAAALRAGNGTGAGVACTGAWIAARAKDRFSMLLATGITHHIVLLLKQ